MMSGYQGARYPVLETVKRRFFIFDRSLTIVLGLILLLGCLAVSSAAWNFPGRFEGHLRNIAVGIAVMWIAAMIPPQKLMRLQQSLSILDWRLAQKKGGAEMAAYLKREAMVIQQMK
jgi:hypothetical protein